PVPRAHS
nr:Chain EEE, PRO-VAL-PRO-ARG [synthetic construct]